MNEGPSKTLSLSSLTPFPAVAYGCKGLNLTGSGSGGPVALLGSTMPFRVEWVFSHHINSKAEVTPVTKKKK